MAVVETPSGEWLIGIDPPSRLCVALHCPAPVDLAARFTAPAYTVAASSSWELEARIGVALGDEIHQALRTGIVIVPLNGTVNGVRVAARGADQLSLDADRMPRGSDLVRLPGGRPLTYHQSLAGSSVLLRWEQAGLEDPSDVFRLDVLALGSEIQDGRRDLTYRLSLNDRVLLAGNDIEVPADIVVRSSDTIRGLVAMLTSPDLETPPTAGQQVLFPRRDELLSLVAENPGPFPPDERVEVRVPDGRLLTGTVTAAIRGADQPARSYQWIPDRSSLPGGLLGPGGVLRGGIVSPASAVRASLLPEPPELPEPAELDANLDLWGSAAPGPLPATPTIQPQIAAGLGGAGG
ncbi:hypothetical protein [Frankia sp. AgB32]|uniref:hypothetical protein n=1 Tax=Frankia sp. AgB32 TaxID=631119 RepID=UPI00201033B9|nr:hypothetical protein [Frankia sp. AgB32]MCK9895017.1 hypothetical protein [Frankia sp. AgB32]